MRQLSEEDRVVLEAVRRHDGKALVDGIMSPALQRAALDWQAARRFLLATKPRYQVSYRGPNDVSGIIDIYKDEKQILTVAEVCEALNKNV